MTTALLGFAGVMITLVVTQTLLHRRWAKEQDEKREALIEERRESDRNRDAQRREEQAEILQTMANQNAAVMDNALALVKANAEDAEKARKLALENAAAHNQCRQEVAHVAGKLEELRLRQVENERTSGAAARISEYHQLLKHQTLTALTVSEGVTNLVVKHAKECTCGCMQPIQDLVDVYKPRLEEILAENQRLFHPKEDQT